MMENDQEFSGWIRALQHSDLPEIDQLKAVFGRVTAQIVEFAEKEIELARAMQDDKTLVQVRIKMETVKTARRIFDRAYLVATGRRAWEEPDER